MPKRKKTGHNMIEGRNTVLHWRQSWICWGNIDQIISKKTPRTNSLTRIMSETMYYMDLCRTYR